VQEVDAVAPEGCGDCSVILIALKEAAYNDSPWRSIGQDPVEIDPMPADHLGTS